MKKLIVALIFIANVPLSRAQNSGDYRTINSGDWASTSIWERFDGSSWLPATSSPASSDGVITIQNGDIVDIVGPLTIDQTVVESGATLNWNTGVLTINNGSGVDLDVQGTIADNSTSSVSFSGGATWQLGNSGTIIRTQNNSSNNWQNAYEGGIASIPTTSNWILRKTGNDTPSVTSIGAYYGNLILENISGSAWSTAGNSNFQGNTGYPTIKGNFDIGGTGSSTPITFTTSNTNATPVTILGNLNVQSTHTLSNSTSGRGFEVNGHVDVDGTLDNDGGASGFGLLRFAGGNHQFLSGGGTYLIREMVVNKSANSAELQRDLSPNNLTLNNGNVVLNSHILTIPSSGTINGGSAISFVNTNSTGVLRRTVGGASIFFPVGNSSFNPITLTNSGTSDIFDVRVFDDVWSEGDEGSGVIIDTDVVGRTWLVTESVSGGSNINMTVQWNGSDELAGFSRGNCYVSRHNGSGWGADSPGSASGTDPYTRTRTGIANLSPFAVASGGALPVELSRFEAALRARQTQLSWSTASETNNAHFIVERGADGRAFSEIGRVAGAGTVREPRAYTFIDERPLPGANYYRLRQVDFDGQFSFSPVRWVMTSLAAGAFLLYPSPASDFLQIQLGEAAETDGAWEIFDAAGRQVMRGVLPAENEALPVFVGDLQPGLYFLRFFIGGQSRRLQSFTKL